MTDASELPVTEVQLLRLRPGDVLVCHADRPLTVDEARELRDRVAAAFPGYPVAVLDSCLELKVARQEEVP